MTEDRKPNFKKWAEKGSWEIWQGVALVMNIDPDKVRRNTDGSFNESPAFHRLLGEAVKVAESKRRDVKWGIEVTEEMIQVATEILWESGFLETRAEGVDELVVEDMLRAALKTKVTTNSRIRYMRTKYKEKLP